MHFFICHLSSFLSISQDNSDDSIKGTSLDIAILKGDVELMVSLLLEHNAKVHNVYYLFRSLILKLAKKSRSNEHFQAKSSDMPEESDIWGKYYIILNLLFSHDNDLKYRIQHSKPSILYTACAFGVIEVVDLLFEIGMVIKDLYRIDEKGMSYWCSLITIMCSDLLSSTASSKPNSEDGIINLLLNDWTQCQKILSLLTSKGLDINHRDKSKSFALGLASRDGHVKLVEWILETGEANVNLEGEDGVTSLMEASASGQTQIAQLLLNQARVDIQDKKGWSALMFASAGGFVKLAQHLLRKGAQPNLQDVNGTTSLMLSSFTGHVELASILLSHGADINLQTTGVSQPS